ncbi:MAG: Glycosyl transferase family 2 [Candidatus Woesebacteria bacterium GW2011_GWB1_43_14]|uniref:Glycosyl transferase family 2 n=1 Tax=Candidatus Woesebacteria bacterium GW2011_GWB1_43_14 TaxID=1618578 RepID=A0A0G1GEH0_9BACT|nr:MAG: Glycosyl transferase family 2 [Candidatus Woesebacteria bacterium GW2011_GWA1_39_11b]KKS78319.1 MAG: Glycosyl transferase family 2 [Candidatus Woesebacteria bacterium GW2011_GWC1_42_9]KKS97263.1 MAG: Glycosyl transferase family 2 [Candidatus Woesebacteria bacterium GW2011_GWB1_43_14]
MVINTLNEEENLPLALGSIKEIADEIIVVDMQSEDKTRIVAKKAGAKVFGFKRMGYVEPARNFAISKATKKWVLILDADEEIPSSLSRKLVNLTRETEYSYFSIPRKNIIFGKWIKRSNWWPDYNIRFFKKGAVDWGDEIHSVPVTVGKGIDLEAREQNAIVHHNYQTVEQYVERMNRYTSIQAKEKYKEGDRFSWKDLIIRPVNEFNSRYFAGYGYEDGVHGLALSGLQAFSELVLYIKLWQFSKFDRQKVSTKEIEIEMRASHKEIAFWAQDMLVKTGGGLISRLKRKFKVI